MTYVDASSDAYQVGTFVKTTSPHVIEVLGAAGLDFAVIDAEHAPFDRVAIDFAMLAGRACGLPLFVRVIGREAPGILSALDTGAEGILVPHVDTAEQARLVVAHARYVGGDRGFASSHRAAGYGSLGMKKAIEEGDRRAVVCQIESVAALGNVREISSVEGVSGIFIGRADLALSMGLDNSQHEQVAAATLHVIETALAAGKWVGMYVTTNEEREKYRALGVRWFVQGSDQSLLRDGARRIARSESVRAPGDRA